MKPEPYLTKRGKELFERLLYHCRELELKDIDSLVLSALAQSLYMIEQASEDLNKNGLYVEAKTGWRQVSPSHTLFKNEMQNIQRLMPKFGLSAEDRDDLKWKPKRKSKLDNF